MYGKFNAVYRANNNKIGANNDAANQSKTMRHSIALRMSKKNKKEQNDASDNAKRRRLSEADGDTDVQVNQFRRSLKRKAERQLNPPNALISLGSPILNSLKSSMSGTIPKRAIKIPQINSDPHVIPYRVGFDPSAMGSDLEVTVHTSQDMAILVLDNARFSGEATDDQDKQWYMHMHVDNSDKRVVQKDTPYRWPCLFFQY
jgi:hypothetical protein